MEQEILITVGVASFLLTLYHSKRFWDHKDKQSEGEGWIKKR